MSVDASARLSPPSGRRSSACSALVRSRQVPGAVPPNHFGDHLNTVCRWGARHRIRILRRHQLSRILLANIRPGKPAPAIGAGTCAGLPSDTKPYPVHHPSGARGSTTGAVLMPHSPLVGSKPVKVIVQAPLAMNRLGWPFQIVNGVERIAPLVIRPLRDTCSNGGLEPR
jgi:hypothetical protein